MKRTSGRTVDRAGGVAAIEGLLRDWIGLDATTIGTPAVERAVRRLALLLDGDAA